MTSKGNSWRPDGWKNPYRDTRQNSFEAGADAMLKALRKGGWHVTDQILPARANGTWVFIPDDPD